MAAFKTVGATGTVTATASNVKSGAISQQSSYLRVVATAAPAQIAVGGDPTASATTLYLAQDVPEIISIGQIRSQPIAAYTKGNTTTITFYEGQGTQFVVGDYVTLTATGQTGFAFSHQEVTAVDDRNSAGVGMVTGETQSYGRIITVDYDSSSVSGTWDTSLNNQSDLRSSFKVGGIRVGGTNSVIYYSQVQITGG